MSDHLIRRLREENETLREHVRQLEDAVVPAMPLPRSWGLTTHQSRLLCAIRAAAPHIFNRERAVLVIYGSGPDHPTWRVMDAQVCYVRRSLRRADVSITFETVPGIGWRMSPESCAAFDAAVAAGDASSPRPSSAQGRPTPDVPPPRPQPWHSLALAMVAKGHTRAEIADAIGRDIRTVKSFLSPGYRAGARRRDRAYKLRRKQLDAAGGKGAPSPALRDLSEGGGR